MSSNKNGYSLLEVVVATTIVGIVIAGGTQALEQAEKSEQRTRILHQMDIVYHDIKALATSPFSIINSAKRDPDSPLGRCILPPADVNQVNSLCPAEARSSQINFRGNEPPGISTTIYGLAPAEDASLNPGNLEVRPVTGTVDNPVRYKINGDLCPGECSDSNHFEARSWFYVECVENTHLTEKCTRGNYIADNVSVFVELTFIRRNPRPQASGRWDCQNQIIASHAAITGRSPRAAIVLPHPRKSDPCRTREFYSTVPLDKAHNLDSQFKCNENAGVAGLETDGRPICQCIPPFVPQEINGRLVENRQGPLCELRGSCPEDQIFRGFKVQEDTRFVNTGRGRGIRYRTTPLCVPVEEVQTSCGTLGARLRSFQYDCRLQGTISRDGGRMRMSCGQSQEKEDAKCFIEK